MSPFDIIDGGYLSWVYGQQWAQSSWPPAYVQGPIVMMDAKEKTHRELRDPTYKQNRRDKRAANPFLAKQSSRIGIFRETMTEDPRVTTVVLPGFEADDLVILAAWRLQKKYGRKAQVLGKDKDLLQGSKSLVLSDHKNVRISLGNFQRRLPKGLHHPKLRSKTVALCLAIMGDKSDNVKRLVPVRRLDIAHEILFDTGYRGAYKEWGQDFLHNLTQVILPDPVCFDFSPREVFDIVRVGDWNPELLNSLTVEMKREVRSWDL